MKKIIDGVTYDTKTATLVASWSDMLITESVSPCLGGGGLYVTPEGKFFSVDSVREIRPVDIKTKLGHEES